MSVCAQSVLAEVRHSPMLAVKRSSSNVGSKLVDKFNSMNQNPTMCDTYASNDVIPTRKLALLILTLVTLWVVICAMTGCNTLNRPDPNSAAALHRTACEARIHAAGLAMPKVGGGL